MHRVAVIPSISVVIPNFNGRFLLEQNLPHLYQALESSGVTDFEVIVSDDASSDDSIAFLRAHYPSVFCLKGERNLGFSGNINRGIHRSTKDLVLLLNSDVQLTPGYFIPQFRYFEFADTFGVMGSIYSMDGSHLQDAAKYPCYRWGALRSTLNYTLISPGESSPRIPSLFLSGANALVDRKKLLSLGGFDEIYNPYYCEDVDLGLRAWRLGYLCYFEPQARCLHPNSATISQQKAERVRRIARRNQFLLHSIHLEGFERRWFMALLAFKAKIRGVVGDQVFRGAYEDFSLMQAQVNSSRQLLRVLSRSSGSGLLTLGEIQTRMLSSIKGAQLMRF